MAARTAGIADYSEVIAGERKEIADDRNGGRGLWGVVRGDVLIAYI
jgi:hypothetical protein